MGLSFQEANAEVGAPGSPFKVPTRVAFTNQPLPRNAAGKFLKREMPGIYFS